VAIVATCSVSRQLTRLPKPTALKSSSAKELFRGETRLGRRAWHFGAGNFGAAALKNLDRPRLFGTTRSVHRSHSFCGRSKMSAATPNGGFNVEQSPKTASPGNGAEFKEDEAWSGDEDDAELEDEGGDGDRKRKRQRLSRPLSVSCELCKSRKVVTLPSQRVARTPQGSDILIRVRSNATEVTLVADGASEMAKSASTRSARSLGCVLVCRSKRVHDEKRFD